MPGKEQVATLPKRETLSQLPKEVRQGAIAFSVIAPSIVFVRPEQSRNTLAHDGTLQLPRLEKQEEKKEEKKAAQEADKLHHSKPDKTYKKSCLLLNKSELLKK